jgi:7-cyano-7-deazaguanine synthase in queuosine biosynthesis
MNKKRLNFLVQNSIHRDKVVTSIPFNRFPRLKVEGIGPDGIDNIAADLIDLGVAVFLIERMLPGKQHVNRAMKIEVELGLRVRSVWSKKAIETLKEVLLFMGGIHWEFRFTQIKESVKPLIISQNDTNYEKVALFSGGLDSLCGAATICKNDDTRLVSFYTRQKDLQRKLASGIKMRIPVQWSVYKGSFTGRGTNYFYRSFLFLCLAAATSRSCGARYILQFENGILASGVSPSLSGRSTKHAHYRVHRLCETIFSEVLGGDWQICNPFEHKTKKDEFKEMVQKLGRNEANNLAKLTESCWHLYAGYKLHGHVKKNGTPCGFCVPCIVRQTAHPQKTWRNLRRDDVRNHPIHGHFFREYYAMLRNIQQVRNKSLGDFYSAVGISLQDAIKPRGGYQLSDLKKLFVRFADEFMLTFNVRSRK